MSFTQIISSKPLSLLKEFKDIYKSRYLLKRLVWRDLKVRYNNTAIGVFWNIMQPLLLMLIFVTFLELMFKNQTFGVPTSIYTYSALCFWQFFARALGQGGTAYNSFQGLITKVYFPRLIAPLSLVIGAAVDFLIAYSLLIALQAFYGAVTLKQFYAVPLIFLGLFLFSLGMAVIFSALSAKFRDITHIIPLLTQLWVFLCPIMYPYTLVSENYLSLYNLNPMVGYIQMFRWAVTFSSPFPDLECVLSSILGTFLVLGISLWYYKKITPTLVDEL